MKALAGAARKHGLRWLCGLLLTAGAALHVTGHLGLDAMERFDTFIAGLRMRVEPAQLDPRIVIVDIDDRSLAAVGRFPWSRDVMARLVTQLTRRYQVAAVGFDVSFPEPDYSSGFGVLDALARRELKDVPGLPAQLERLRERMDYDGLLAAAMAGQPVVLGYATAGSQVKGVLPPPAFTEEALNGRTLDAWQARGYEANIARLQQAAQGAGIFSVLPDRDGVVRSTPLLQKIGTGYYPTLSLATVAVALRARAIAPLWEDTVDTLTAAQRASGGLDAIALFHPEGAIRIPVGEGLSTTVQFRGSGGPQGGAFRYVSALDVLRGTVPAPVLDGVIVLVGTTAAGLNDLRATPVSAVYPGVEVHANLIKSILDDSFKARPDYAVAVELAQVLLAGVVLTFALAVLAPAWSILLSVAALATAAWLNFHLYSAYDAVLNLAPLLVLILALFVFNLAWGYFFEVRRGRALVSRFGEYVAPELVAEMAENPERYTMEGESRDLTVLFVDVRGFTTISEGLPPRELREYINRYLTAMSEDIRDSHRGTLDKYIGDAVMAFWGAPVPFPDHASRAVATALLMQRSATRLDGEFRRRGWPPLAIGIGINSGPMHVGDMGSSIRRAYTVMGDAVNLAARLEGITKVYDVGIVVGAATRAATPEFAYRELDLVRVKGKREPVAIFEPVGPAADVDAATQDELARWHEALAYVRAQRWDEAEAALRTLAAATPQRRLYALYLERIAVYRAAPPGPGWDGVTAFETK
ncbi:CHASE2 domain-containing protein [Pseudoduganella chitinolytica]|uniref:Adenylate/guanylate cyclase domain-containing protein n=1 Tax=Pseudoduganella chitinolytica TaxID=34070 RepID=A0ABY8BCI2_9BURK|nr:adenylate/guanylate cyclase domain-containing protein [Pseudoduganella chitinolytica]WEF33416.1 adenylate/guanylate cyclase domain-containing protein [Pseudoduganella chitinolytica]